MTLNPAPNPGDLVRSRLTGALGTFVRTYDDPAPIWVVHYDGDEVDWSGRPDQFHHISIDTVTPALRALGVYVNVWRHSPRHRFDPCIYGNHSTPIAATCTVYRRTGRGADACLACVVRATEDAIADTRGRPDLVTAEVCRVDQPPAPPTVRPEIRYGECAHRGAGRTEYRVTFGSGHVPHPRLPEAHPDGWLTVVAADELAARVATIERIGRAWAFIYSPGDSHYPDERHYPRGEVYRIVIGGTVITLATPGGHA